MAFQNLFKNFIWILYLGTLTSCAGPQKPCLESPEGLKARGIWDTSN